MTVDRPAGCRTCGRFEVAVMEARRHLERYVRYRPPRVSDAKYLERIAGLKARIASQVSAWNDHKRDQHAEVPA